MYAWRIYVLKYFCLLSFRQSAKEYAKEELILEEKRELQWTLQELALNIERQDAQIRHLQRTVAELESRKWLPRINILGSSKNDDSNDNLPTEPTPPPSPPPPPSPSPSFQSHTTGNYDPNNGFLFKSLNLIENEILYSPSDTEGHRIIHEALVYLKLI